MGTTNEFERDLQNQAALKRPGRIDLRIFQNISNAGDGYPGLQRCFRNYLHEGGMEKDIDLIGFGIIGTSVNINNAELQQLSNIGSSVITVSIWSQIDNIEATTVSPTQWGYVGGADQDVRQADSPTFVGLTLSADVITTSTFDSVDVSDLKDAFDTHTASTGASHTYIDQSVVTSTSPTFVGLTLSADLVTTSTIDGIDVSAIKLNSMPTAADGDISANTQKIINVVDPTSNQDASTKIYVDDIYKVSDDLKFSNDTERSQASQSYVKVKEIQCYMRGNIRLYWEHYMSADADAGESRVYLNGAAVSTVRTATTSYTPETNDMSVEVGDLIQIYGWAYKEPSLTRTIYVRYQRIKYIDFISTSGY